VPAQYRYRYSTIAEVVCVRVGGRERAVPTHLGNGRCWTEENPGFYLLSTRVQNSSWHEVGLTVILQSVGLESNRNTVSTGKTATRCEKGDTTNGQVCKRGRKFQVGSTQRASKQFTVKGRKKIADP